MSVESNMINLIQTNVMSLKYKKLRNWIAHVKTQSIENRN